MKPLYLFLAATAAAQECTPQSHPKTWWRSSIAHNGTTPTSTDTTYQYFRNVLHHGADSTGARDSSHAFSSAISGGSRSSNTVTTRPAYVYVPPGRYLIKEPINMLVYTSLIGDAVDLPVLVADPELGDQPVINGYDGYQGTNGPTKNFYMAVRNFRIETGGVDSAVEARGMEWSVSQSCSLTNVHFVMPGGSKHKGVVMTWGGSAVIIADCTFKGGAVGIEVGSQQYLLKNLEFDGCEVGIYMNWSFVVTVQGARFANCRYGIDAGREKSVGAMSVVDSTADKCEAGVLAYVTGTGENSLVLDNFAVRDGVAVKSATTNTTFLGGSVPAGKTWVLGNTSPYNYQSGAIYDIRRPASLLVDDKYFTAPLPQYEDFDASQVVNIKSDSEFPVYGDNLHNDGPSINALLWKHSGCKVIFFPQGIYSTEETIYVPPGSRIVGEVFSTITGMGSAFKDADNPQPIVKVGNEGERGVAQFSDLLVSVGDILPGAILVEVNMRGDKPADVGFWNVVLRVGGSHDTLVNTKCNDKDPGVCKAAWGLLRVTESGGGYFEGVWGWVADHGLDPHLNMATGPQNIAVGRGALIENQKAPTWMVGTSFEHCVLYQYNLNKVDGVFISLQQTESPYWQGQGTPYRAPAPWKADPVKYGDPTFENCERQGLKDDDRCHRSWAHHMVESRDVVIHGSAFWVFFNNMNASDDGWKDAQCTATGDVCQENLVGIDGAKSTFWYSMTSKSVERMVYDTTGGGLNVTAQKEVKGSWGGAIAAYLRRAQADAGDILDTSGNPGRDGNGNEGGGNNAEGDETGEEDGVGRLSASGRGLLSAGLALFYFVYFLV